MEPSELVAVASAVAGAGAAAAAWIQVSADREVRFAAKHAARRAAAPLILKVTRVLDALISVTDSLQRARLLGSVRSELWGAYELLSPMNATLSEADALAVIRAGIRLEAADAVLSEYARDQGWHGPVDRLPLAGQDLVAAREELEGLLEPCLRQMRRELRERPGYLEELVDAMAREVLEYNRKRGIASEEGLDGVSRP